MVSDEIMLGNLCYLKDTQYTNNVLENYLLWMNDKEVTKYLYARNGTNNKETLLAYVNSVKNSSDSYIFGIYYKMTDTYIGNVKIGPIHTSFKFGEIGYMIGDKHYWQKGYGTEVVSLICQFGFNKLFLHKITSGCNELNTGSNAVLRKNGFVLEGVLRKHEYMEGIGFTNKNVYGLLQKEYEERGN